MTWGVWRSASGFGPQIGGVVNVPTAGGGPPAFDAASEATASNTTLLSWTHTPVGTPTGVVVGVSYWQASLTNPTAATYGGAAMTEESIIDSGGDPGAESRVVLYSLANPASGAQTVSISFDPSTYPCGGCISVTDGSTTDVLGTVVTNFGPITDVLATATVTSASDELVVDVVSVWNAPTVGADQTERVSTNSGTLYTHMSTQPGAASVDMTWTFTANIWGIIAAPINPA
jgi:hypothetical protein